MKFKKKKVIGIICFTTFALVGLIFLQVYLLTIAFELKHQAFRQNVNAALSAIVQQLETRETYARVIGVSLSDSLQTWKSTINMEVLALGDSTAPVNKYFFKSRVERTHPDISFDSSKIYLNLPSPQKFRLVILDSAGQDVDVIEEFKPAGQHEIDLQLQDFSSYTFHFYFVTDSINYLMKFDQGHRKKIVQKIDFDLNREAMIEKVLDELSYVKREPIDKRINPVVLDSLITKTLEVKGIQMPFAYGIVSQSQDSVMLAQPQNLRGKIAASNFKTRLFPSDLLLEPNDLALYFPDQRFYLFRQISTLVIISFILILVVAISFIYTIRTIFQQKEFSTRLTNFINNMTHEFKTPISTISLASESIKNPAIMQKQEKLKKYSSIIADENLRMRNQVEKILQMAVLEEGDYELNLIRIDIHQLITQAIQNVALQIEKRKGKIMAKLKAVSSTVEADSLHFSNIIHNLLDNAIKYTREKPEILIETKNVNDRLLVRVKDNGIGINPEEQNRIFDKYYRVPTGNVHDVKGFGLGLSYVKLLVEAHGGTIKLQSEVAQGTEFDIYLPLNK